MIKLLFHTQRFHCFVAVIITEKKGKSILFISTHSEFSCLLLSLLSCFLFYELFKALDRLVELEQFSGCCYPHLRSYYLIGSDNLYLTKFIRCKDTFFQPVFESCGYFHILVSLLVLLHKHLLIFCLLTHLFCHFSSNKVSCGSVTLIFTVECICVSEPLLSTRCQGSH